MTVLCKPFTDSIDINYTGSLKYSNLDKFRSSIFKSKFLKYIFIFKLNQLWS